MVGRRIRVHPAALADTAELVERGARHLGESLDVADALVRDLSSAWAGEASDAFQHAAGAWRLAFADTLDSLERLRGVLSVARENYTSAEAANLRMWRAGR